MSSTGHLSELDLLRGQVADLSRELAARDRALREQSLHLDRANLNDNGGNIWHTKLPICPNLRAFVERLIGILKCSAVSLKV